MYEVYIDDYLIYKDNIGNKVIINPKLELELNKAGKFTFSIHDNHPYYKKLNKLKSIVRVFQDGYLLFRGRILNSERGFYNEQKITCEGELAFFNDSIIAPKVYPTDGQISVSDLFSKFISEHNSQVDEEKKFIVGVVDVKDGDTSNTDNLLSRSNSDYDTTWNSITKKLIEPLGGYLRIRHEGELNYIDYLSDINTEASQTIEFGKNLTDVLETIKGEDLFTGIIPLGAKHEETGERITIESVSEGGVNYLLSEQYKIYGKIFKTVVWDDVHEPENLLNKAISYLTSLGSLNFTTELKAVDISPLNKNIKSFRLGTKIQVISKYHDINDSFLIKKLSIDLMKPESNKITIGATKQNFTEKMSSTTSSISSIGQKIDSTEEKINTVNVELSSRISSDIEVNAESILQTVSDEYYTKGQTNTLVEQTRTEFEQTDDEFNFRFNQYEADLQDIQNGTDAQFEEIRKYIRFVNGNIILGEEGNELTLKIQNDRISFLENDIEVAYVSNKKLYITDGTFINSMNIGNFGFFPRANGNLSLKKVGE